jgi:alcohol dehydrogenase (cytochrome c)
MDIMNRLFRLVALMTTLGCLPLLAQQGATEQVASQPVTSQMLLDGLKDPATWPMVGGNYNAERHSPLTQLTPQNVDRLTPKWMFQTQLVAPGRGFESTPIVVGGVLYITGINNNAWALDARTGHLIWHYQRDVPASIQICCGRVNRGFGILGDKLFMGTLDAHLVALDRKTGKVLWDTAVGDPKDGYSITVAPVIVKNKVIVGIAGGEFATRCFIDAYDAETGARVWRFYTIPAPGEPGSESWPNVDVMQRGGGGVWNTASYDPELNLVYYGTANPNPDYYGDDRKGDDLYTCSLVALDVDTGKLKWHYQFTPHDTHDWDSTQVPVLGDLTIGGQPHKVLMLANRNSFFYVLDRKTGKLLLGKPFNGTNWAREIGPDGRPVVLDDIGTADKCLPDNRGGTNFMPPSYDPVRHLFFLVARESCATFAPLKPATITPGGQIMGGRVQHVPNGPPQYSYVLALDPATGARVWEYHFSPSYPSNILLDDSGGVTSTASGLVFAGNNNGYLYALDSTTGKELWSFQTGGSVYGTSPVTFMLDGSQWIVVNAGGDVIAFALPGGGPSS